ncbi:GntR family transcriptional regulator [Pediococcus siamensis]|uniref:GntR family transcriptional regulator n=1 Tax=Pediococcus siamensis TaxID=381829 RepID=UPI0039A2E8D5
MQISINKKSMIPVYEQIANELRDKMYNGDLQDGDQIDSEPKLCMILKVSRGTVRKALEVLIKEGRLTKIHGKGTFVTNPDVAYPLGGKLYSFAETLDMQHLNYDTQVVKQDLLSANKEIAEHLNIPIGDKFLYLERLRSVQGEKVMLIENRVNINICPGIERKNFNNVSLFAEIEGISGKSIDSAMSTYEALTVGNKRGDLLNLPASSPIFKVQQTVFMPNHKPIEYGSVWLKANKYFLTTTLQRR